MSDRGGSSSRVSFADPQVNLYTADIVSSLRFYRDVLGFTETFRIPAEGVPDHVELGGARMKLGLATFESLRSYHGVRTDRGPPRVEVALFTEDPDGAYAWSTAHGATSLRPPSDFGGYIRNARVADPDGNPIVFTTPLPLKHPPNSSRPPEFSNHLYNVLCRDIERSLQFYRDRLGFSETFRTPKEGPPDHVELELGPLNLGVSTVEALHRHHGLTGGGGPPRGEVVLWVQDVDAAHAALVAQGAPSLSSPHDFAGVLRAAWLGDPDGNPIQVVMRSPERR